MAVVVTQARTELTRNRGKTSRQRTSTYFVDGVTTPEEAEAATGVPAFGSALGTDASMTVSSIRSEVVEGRVTRYKVSVTYSYEKSTDSPDEHSDGDETYRFGGRLEGIQKTSAIVQTAYGGMARDVGKLVGAKDDGTVEGAPWHEPVGQLVVTYYKTASAINDAFINSILAELGKVNSAAYYGQSADELKFVDFDIPKEGETLSQLQFTFEIRKTQTADLPSYTDPEGNAVNFPAGGLKGWEWAWTDEVQSDDAGNDLTPRVRGLYIAQLYQRSAFAALPVSGSL